ncbi:MAG TPA: universal stress protein [Gemmatimonadaceae bacterium]|nr:universal stress protein [Gemmatimonadaceae bacterium]
MRLDTAVVGIDFSPESIATANWIAGTLAPAARVVLAHAIEPPARPAFLVAETLPPEMFAISAQAKAHERLADIAATIHGPSVNHEVRTGRAHTVIAELAKEVGADLVALGPHRNYEHSSMLLGTTADVVIRNASVPVLIGSRLPSRNRTRVVAGVTDSSALPRVFAFADDLAARLGARLTLVNVIESAAYTHMASVAAAHAHGDDERERAEVEGNLRWQTVHWLWKAAAAGIEPARVDTRVEHGAAAEAILEVARQEKAALIVLGGHTPVRHLPSVLGRTVRHVLYGARCGVVVVPALS